MGERLEALQEASCLGGERQQSGRINDDRDKTRGVRYWPSRRNRSGTPQDYSFTDSALGRGENSAPGSDTEREQSNVASARNERSTQNKRATSISGTGQSMNVYDAIAESHPLTIDELPRDAPRYSHQEKENASPPFLADIAHRAIPTNPRTNSSWTTAEEQELKTLRDAGKNWRSIARAFPTRTERSLIRHWYRDLHHADLEEQDRVEQDPKHLQ